MKKTLIALVLGALFAIPCMLHAEEVEIRLSVVLEMETIGGLEPLDNPKHKLSHYQISYLSQMKTQMVLWNLCMQIQQPL